MRVLECVYWAVVKLLCVLLRSAGPVPAHVAFIMDGNRRFATSHGEGEQRGHRQGYSKVRALPFPL